MPMHRDSQQSSSEVWALTDERELTAIQRAALVSGRLFAGERLSNAQVADLCGYARRQSAYFLMMRLALVLPLTFDRGVWFLADGSEGCDE